MENLKLKQMEQNNIPLILTPDYSGQMSKEVFIEVAKSASNALEAWYSNAKNAKTQVFHTPKGF